MAIQDYLTIKSNYLIDWRRPGSLFFSNHHYSNKEMIERGFVILSTAVFGYFGWNLTKSKGYAALAALIGFTVSHGITMYPLIQKRKEAQAACKEFNLVLQNKSSRFDTETNGEIKRVVDLIMVHADSKSASAVWGKRSRLMRTLVNLCEQHAQEMLLQILGQTDIIERLNENNFNLDNLPTKTC